MSQQFRFGYTNHVRPFSITVPITVRRGKPFTGKQRVKTDVLTVPDLLWKLGLMLRSKGRLEGSLAKPHPSAQARGSGRMPMPSFVPLECNYYTIVYC